MTLLAAVPLLVSLVLAGFARPLGRRLRPGLAVPLLTAAALTAAVCTGLVLSVAGVLAAAQVAPLAHLGHWSSAAVRSDRGYPAPLGVLAGGVALACLVVAARRGVRSAADLTRAARTAQSLHPAAGDLVLVEDTAPEAYAVAAWRGRIVVTTGLLDALTADERRVVLAHEAAHVRHRHFLYLHAARLAAAANPLLRSVVGVVAHAIERWADEDAARVVGDRTLAAQALARVALATVGRPAVPVGLAAAQSGVPERVRALLAGPPQRRAELVMATVAGAALCWAAAGAVVLWAHDVIQLAEAVYGHH